MKLLKADFSKYLKNEEIIQKIKEMKVNFQLSNDTQIDLIDYCFYAWRRIQEYKQWVVYENFLIEILKVSIILT